MQKTFRILNDNSGKFFIEEKKKHRFLFWEWETWEYIGERCNYHGYFAYLFETAEVAKARILEVAGENSIITYGR